MKIAIMGLGRAGKVLVKKVLQSRQDELVCGICRKESGNKGKDIGMILEMPRQGIPVLDMDEFCSFTDTHDVDVIIDFSHKSASLKLAEICAQKDIGLVVCTTDFNENEIDILKNSVRENSLIYAPNLTIGINLLMEFVERISKILPDFDFEIIERHMKGKPPVTTTAKRIASVIQRDDVPISSVRVGGYVGVHEVTAANENERLTIVHESFTRNAFASGALMAARYICGKSGYYEMKDVIYELEKNVGD